MMNAIILGLISLSGITGFTSGTTYSNQQDDFANMADAINQQVIDNNGDFSISNTSYCNDLYTTSGENRYFELCWNDGYLIYDKKDKEVDELSYINNSPYLGYQDRFKVYNEEIFNFKYVIYDGSYFVNIDENSIIDDEITAYYRNSFSTDAGNYYRDMFPSNNAHIARNDFYFKNLNEMHAWNSLGTCTVVSAEILLGYYDTFVNDEIVAEKYDRISSEAITNDRLTEFIQSPGVDDYRNGVHKFHDMLVSIARDEVGDDPEIDGMNTINQIQMIKKYLNKNNINYSINSSEGNLSDIWTQRAISIIKTGIDEGRPVISNGTRHSTVAYAYDSQYVYVHTGWGWAGATPWSTYESGIFSNYSAGCIDLKFEGEIEHCHSNNYFSTITNNYICPCGALHKEILLSPNGYGFESQYFFSNKSKIINCENLTIETERLRTGFIEEKYINLSPRRDNAGDAFLEYKFNKSVERLSFDISFWGNSEFLSPFDSYAYFQIKNSYGIWATNIDLLNDVSLSKDRNNQSSFSFNFKSKDVYAIRFVTHSSAVGNRNKGRISIGNMTILHNA